MRCQSTSLFPGPRSFLQREKTSNRLEEAHRMALETEQIGISTLGDLNRQRQQIEHARDGLGQADSWIAKSQGLLKTMHRRYFDS